MTIQPSNIYDDEAPDSVERAITALVMENENYWMRVVTCARKGHDIGRFYRDPDAMCDACRAAWEAIRPSFADDARTRLVEVIQAREERAIEQAFRDHAEVA